MISFLATNAMMVFYEYRALKARQVDLITAFGADPSFTEVTGMRAPTADSGGVEIKANAQTGEGVTKGAMIAGIVILMLIEFVFQFLLIWFFGWLAMKVMNVPFFYFASVILGLIFLLTWFVNLPMIMKQLEARKYEFTGEGLTPQERRSAKQQFFLGYVMNVVISIVVLLLVARILGVPATLPSGEPLPLPGLDTEQLATALVIGFAGRVGTEVFGPGSQTAKTPYASALVKHVSG